MTIERINTGKLAEDLACSFLKNQGYKIISRNYRSSLGEIDIIADDNGCFSFVEVRSKNAQNFSLPEESITSRKQNQIAKTALTYIKRFSLQDKDCRFDVVCIEEVKSLSPKIRLIKDAFELNLRYRY